MRALCGAVLAIDCPWAVHVDLHCTPVRPLPLCQATTSFTLILSSDTDTTHVCNSSDTRSLAAYVAMSEVRAGRRVVPASSVGHFVAVRRVGCTLAFPDVVFVTPLHFRRYEKFMPSP